MENDWSKYLVMCICICFGLAYVLPLYQKSLFFSFSRLHGFDLLSDEYYLSLNMMMERKDSLKAKYNLH